MREKIKPFLSAIFIVLLGIAVSVSQAQTPQETLNQYISDLQNNPNDYALREKIIKFVQEMIPAPAIPEEARRHYVKACTLFEDAKQPSDSADAAEEFRQALLVAPWWGEAYMKMGLALETAQRYDDAIASLKLFMATNSQGEVLRKTQDEIYKIEAKAQKAVKDKELAAKKAVEDKRALQEDAEAKKILEQEDWLKKIDGRRYTCPAGDGVTMVIDIRGKVLVRGIYNNGQYQENGGGPGENPRIEILGRETTVRPNRVWLGVVSRAYIISKDGERITERVRFNDGDLREYIYLWQR